MGPKPKTVAPTKKPTTEAAVPGLYGIGEGDNITTDVLKEILRGVDSELGEEGINQIVKDVDKGQN